MVKFGLKLWSTNERYIAEAIRLYDQGVYSFIELFAEPGTYESHIHLWKDLPVPFVVHAPHFQRGLNLAIKESYANNIVLLKETCKFADALNADTIVVHPGVGGKIDETVRQLNELHEQRILVENKPYYALGIDAVCTGNSPDEIRFALEHAGVGFCLDIGHAICAANAYKKEPINYLHRFLKLNPRMFHLTDGDYKGVRDIHYHIGRGNFNLKRILSLLPVETRVTIETEKSSADDLNDFKDDVAKVKLLLFGNFIIRRAAENDLMNVYHLSNDTAVRMNSFSQNHIPLADHERWFPRAIHDSNTAFYIVTGSPGVFIGQVRFDRLAEEENGYRVSISLVPEARGIGLGFEILKAAALRVSRDKKAKVLHAFIRRDNTASRKMFLKAGFTPVSENGSYLELRRFAGSINETAGYKR